MKNKAQLEYGQICLTKGVQEKKKHPGEEIRSSEN